MGCRITYGSPFHLQQESDGTVKRPPDGVSQRTRFTCFGEGFAECGNHKALRMRA